MVVPMHCSIFLCGERVPHASVVHVHPYEQVECSHVFSSLSSPMRKELIHMSETRLRVGDRAIDAQLPDLTGTPVTLSTLWQSQGMILSFLRHFG